MTCSSVKGDRRNRISVSGGSATGISENRPDMEIGVKSGDSRNSRDTRPDSAAVGWLHGCAATASTTDSFSSWIVVAGCFIVQALTIGSTYTFGVIYVDLLQEFGQSKAATAWIGSIQSALLYLTGIFVGPLIIKLGGRTVAVFGALMSSVGFMTSALVTSMHQLYFTYGFATGIGNGLMYVTSSIVLHYHFDRMRTLANGVAVTGSGVGTLIFAFLVQSLLTHVKWRLTLVIEGAIMLIGIACAALYLPPPVSVDVDAIVDERQPLIADAARARLSADDGSHRGEPTAANGSIGCFRSFVSATFGHLSLLRCRPFALLVIANILYSFGYHIPYAYMPDRARHVADVDPDRAAALISIMGSASVCGRLFGGLAFIECRRRSADVDGNDSRGSRRCSAASMRFVVTVATMVGSGLTTALVFAMTEFWSMVIYAVLTGVFGGVWATLFGVVIVDVMGVNQVANTLGLAMAFSSIGFLLASPFAGWMIHVLGGDFNVPFAVLGVTQVISGLVAAMSRCFPPPNVAAASGAVAAQSTEPQTQTVASSL